MNSIIRSTWPLFFGIALLQIGNGLQGTLLGLRANMESFSTQTTGLIMTGYYIGFLAGSNYTASMIRSVGHIRVFAALASLASTGILVHAVYINPVTWLIARLASGFCYAGLYIVVESWLNDRSTNETRGSLFSVYMVLSFMAMAFGQWTLKLADPGSYELFVLVSVLISLSLIPLLVTNSAVPSVTESEKISYRELFMVSPLGTASIFGVGLAHSAVFGMGAVYAARVGMSVSDTALFLSAFIIGGVLFQWPIGKLSDRFDRRVILTLVTFVAAALALLLMQGEASFTFTALLFAIYGGLSLSLYSLAIAHTNDRLKPEQMIGASGGLIMLYGIGSMFGPISISIVLDILNTSGFFTYLLFIHAIIGLVALFMMSWRDAVAADEQSHFIAVPPRSTPIAAEVVAEMVDQEFQNQEQMSENSGEREK